MTRRKHAVQFQMLTEDNDSASLLIEQLRYAGLVSIIRETQTETGQAYLLQIRAPHGLNDGVWARHQVERMASFGINAADVYVD